MDGTPTKVQWREVRVWFKMPDSSCLTKMSWCRLGGILTCRKCIKAMRLPRWNGVLWGFSAGLLRCNTRPWHFFVGLHPKSKCIMMTDGAPSYDVCWLFWLSSVKERRKKEYASAYQQSSTQYYINLGWKWEFKMPVSSCFTEIFLQEASKQWGSHDGMVFFEGSLGASCDATPGLGTAL